ncbi:MAG: hypothetical protein AB1752_05985 [Candidatus Zixiibacteriota bacterium]
MTCIIIPRRRVAAVFLILSHLWIILLPDAIRAQGSGCGYDRGRPTVAGARTSFQVFDFECAERELNDVLKQGNLTSATRAEAHALLAAVHYQSTQDSTHRREKVLGQLREVFKADAEWRGTLDIQGPEFLGLVDQARRDVERSAAKPPATAKTETPKMERPVDVQPTGKSGGGSKKWIYVALGAGVIGVAALALGGGGGGGATDQNLPDFPPHPSNGGK